MNDEIQCRRDLAHFDFRHWSFVIPSSFEFRHSHSDFPCHCSAALVRLLQRVLQLLAVLVYRVRYSGRQNIPAAGGVLVVSNHQSHFDPPLVGIGCPRRMNYVARDTLFRFRPFRLADQLG